MTEAELAALEAQMRSVLEDPPRRWPLEDYRGVWGEETAGPVVYEAVLEVNGNRVSGGEYETAEEAARAYDALSIMYFGEAGAKLNFPATEYQKWKPQDFERLKPAQHIEAKPGVPLDREEIIHLLQAEKGINVQCLDLTGRSDLAHWMIFVTGRSVPHMRKLARMVVKALWDRQLPGYKNAEVEGLDMDDWMVVDCGDIIVNVMDAEAREVFDLENFYSNMKIGVDPYEGYSFDEWLAANPIPEKWKRRLERDEEDLAAKGARRR